MNNQNEKLTNHPTTTPSLLRGWIVIGIIIGFLITIRIIFTKISLETTGIWILWGLIILTILAPFIVFAVWITKVSQWKIIGLAISVWFMNFSCLLLMRGSIFFTNMDWNWTGKISSIIASIIFIGIWQGITWKEVGFTNIRKGSWIPTIVLIIVFVCFFGQVAQSSDAPTKIRTLLFQITMPSIDEEIIFRGIFLALLNRAFGRQWNILGAKVGWGWIISSTLFGIAHGIGYINSSFQFSLFPMVITGIGGFIMCWLRERTGSLYPSMILHTIWDSIGSILNIFVNGLA